jgi:hypothetical protein
MPRIPRNEVHGPESTASIFTECIASAGRLIEIAPDAVPREFDKRRQFTEEVLQHFAQHFAIEIEGSQITGRRILQLLKPRPDIAQSLSPEDVARRWLMICPSTRRYKSTSDQPSPKDIRRLCRSPRKIASLRCRLSDVAWWNRLLCQRIATRFNRLDSEIGGFWGRRYRSILILDEVSRLACLAYINLREICNQQIPAISVAEFIDQASLCNGQFTEVLTAYVKTSVSAEQNEYVMPTVHVQTEVDDAICKPTKQENPADHSVNTPAIDTSKPSTTTRRLISPAPTSAESQEARPQCGPCPAGSRLVKEPNFAVVRRIQPEYGELFVWTFRRILFGSETTLPPQGAAILQKLGINEMIWIKLVSRFSDHFSQIAGKPQLMDSYRSRISRRRFFVRPLTRQLFHECS